jgi:hypothetical protein
MTMWKKYCRTGRARDDNMAHAHCMLDANTHSECIILLFHYNSGWMNAPQCCGIHKYQFLLFLILGFCGFNGKLLKHNSSKNVT